jgi:hypothetical protein
MRGRRAFEAIIATAVILLYIGGALLLRESVETSQATDNFATQLRDGLVESCEKNGNPLREYLASQALEEIAESKSLDYEEFFPNIPPDKLHDLLQAQNESLREALKGPLSPIDCAGLYPR